MTKEVSMKGVEGLVHRDCLAPGESGPSLLGAVFEDLRECPRCEDRLFDSIGAASIRGGVVRLSSLSADKGGSNARNALSSGAGEGGKCDCVTMPPGKKCRWCLEREIRAIEGCK